MEPCQAPAAEVSGALGKRIGPQVVTPTISCTRNILNTTKQFENRVQNTICITDSTAVSFIRSNVPSNATARTDRGGALAHFVKRRCMDMTSEILDQERMLVEAMTTKSAESLVSTQASKPGVACPPFKRF